MYVSIYGPPYWYGIDADLGLFKKTMWFEVMNEINCTGLSTWSSCDDQREKVFTQSLGQTWIVIAIGLHLGTDIVRHEVKLCSTWDHYFDYTTIQDTEGQIQISSSQTRRRWSGWSRISEDEKVKFKNKVMGANGTETEKCLVEIQKIIEEVAKNITETPL